MSGTTPGPGHDPDADGRPAALVDAAGAMDLLTDRRFLVDSVLPPVLFVAVHALADLRWAAAVSLGFAALILAWRVRGGHRLLFAWTGLAGAAVSVGLALVSGRASAYFVPGIIGNAAFAVACIVSVFVRRPLIAVTSRVLYRWPWGWYLDDRVRPAYAEITLVWAAAYLARAGAQGWLAARDAVGALAFVRIATGLPVFTALLALTYGYVNWRLRTLGAPDVETFAARRPPVDDAGAQADAVE